MANLLEPPSYLTNSPRHRELRVCFESRASLLAGFARAQRESWIEDCRVDLPRLELWIRMAGGRAARPRMRGRSFPVRALPAARPVRRENALAD